MKHATPDVRRAQLFAAAMAVVAEKGFHATTVDDIAARAGLSKGAVYHHFDSKLDLFVSLLEDSMDEFTDMIDHTVDGSARDAVLGVVRAALAAYTPDLRTAFAELFMVSMQQPAFAERFRRHYDGMIHAGANLFRRGIANGEFRPDLDPEQASNLVFMGVDGLTFVYLALGRNADADAAVLDLAKTLLDGFAARTTDNKENAS